MTPLRAVRGGSFNHTPYGLRSAFRSKLGPTLRNWDYGARLVARLVARPAEVPRCAVRGGSFLSTPGGLRSAYRYWDWPMDRLKNGGVRLVARAAP